MGEKRTAKPDDQDKTEEAYHILQKAMIDNPQIEQTLWAAACWSCLVEGHRRSGINYDEFCSEIEGVREFFKNRWG